MKHISRIVLLILVVASFVSCTKDPDQKGCTDQYAANYDARALADDGSCVYNQDVQRIWTNGVRGGWNSDLQEGAYRFQVCSGESSVLTEIVDSVTTTHSLYVGTGGGTSHLSYFTLINERNAQNFNQGSLRMDVRVADTDDGAPEFANIFISGKLPQTGECNPYRRSEHVEISTHSFNDSTFTTVNIPILHFSQIMMAHVEVAFGIEFEGERSTGLEIDNIRWVANLED